MSNINKMVILTLLFALSSCNSNSSITPTPTVVPTSEPTVSPTEEPTEEINKKFNLSTLYEKLNDITIDDVLEVQIYDSVTTSLPQTYVNYTNDRNYISSLLAVFEDTEFIKAVEDENKQENNNYQIIDLICKDCTLSIELLDEYLIDNENYKLELDLPELSSENSKYGMVVNCIDEFKNIIIMPNNNVKEFDETKDLLYSYEGTNYYVVGNDSVKINNIYYKACGILDFSIIYQNKNNNYYTINIVDSIVLENSLSIKYNKDEAVDYEKLITDLNLTNQIRKIYSNKDLTLLFDNVILDRNIDLYLGNYEYSEDFKLDLNKYGGIDLGYYKLSATNYFTTYNLINLPNSVINSIKEKSETTPISSYAELVELFGEYKIEEIIESKLFDDYKILVCVRESEGNPYVCGIYNNLIINEERTVVDCLLVDSYKEVYMPEYSWVVDLVLMPLSDFGKITNQTVEVVKRRILDN